MNNSTTQELIAELLATIKELRKEREQTKASLLWAYEQTDKLKEQFNTATNGEQT